MAYYIGVMKDGNPWVFATQVTPTKERYPDYCRMFGPFKSDSQAAEWWDRKNVFDENPIARSQHWQDTHRKWTPAEKKEYKKFLKSRQPRRMGGGQTWYSPPVEEYAAGMYDPYQSNPKIPKKHMMIGDRVSFKDDHGVQWDGTILGVHPYNLEVRVERANQTVWIDKKHVSRVERIGIMEQWAVYMWDGTELGVFRTKEEAEKHCPEDGESYIKQIHEQNPRTCSSRYQGNPEDYDDGDTETVPLEIPPGVSEEELGVAAEVYGRFHDFGPTKIDKIDLPKPKVLTKLGTFSAIGYHSDKWKNKRKLKQKYVGKVGQQYLHEFKKWPNGAEGIVMFAPDKNDSEYGIIIAIGRCRVTQHGIEDVK